MTLLQGDRCCSLLLSWGLEKTGKEHSPRDFHTPTVHGAAPAAVECHGAESSKAEPTGLPGCRAILGNVCSSPWWEGTALSPSLHAKLLGLSSPHRYFPKRAKLKTGKENLENKEVITSTQKKWNFFFTAQHGCSPLSAIPQVSLGQYWGLQVSFLFPSSVPRVALMAETAQSQM